MSAAEIKFLKAIRNRPMSVNEALEIDFGTEVDAIDIIKKFLVLGFLEYQNDTGKFFFAVENTVNHSVK